LFASPGLQAWESDGIKEGRPSGLFLLPNKGLKAYSLDLTPWSQA